MNDPSVRARLEGGLLLRHALPADQDALASFQVDAHRRDDAPQASAYLDTYTHDLFTRPHPLIGVSDFLLITEGQSGTIVSSVQLIHQVWTYGGISIPVSQIELVGTLPAYRRRGLARRLIEEAHTIGIKRGSLVEIIGGNPNFYRQFGYEYGVMAGDGRGVHRTSLPLPVHNATTLAPFRIRPARKGDVQLLMQADAEAMRRNLVYFPREAAMWRYELDGRSESNRFHHQVRIIETAAGEPVGMLIYTWSAYSPWLNVVAYELLPSSSWLAVTPWVLHYLHQVGMAPANGYAPTSYEGIWFWLGTAHPAYDTMSSRLMQTQHPTILYARVPDMASFLRTVAPILEARLPGTVAAGYSGELTLSFYQNGLYLRFDQGRLIKAAAWQPLDDKEADAAFPGLTFLPLLFGYRTFAQQEEAYPDCLAHSDKARALLTTLFPALPSRVWSPF